MRLLKLAKIMIAAAAAVFALSVNSYAGAWMHDTNGWWYCNDNRSYTTDNWQQINGSWYYFDARGYMVTGWKQVGGSWYYLHADGKMAHDAWIDGPYYVGSDGRMLTNTTTPDGYRVGADGKWTNNSFNSTTVSNYWMYHVSECEPTIYLRKQQLIDHGNYYELTDQKIKNYYSTYAEAEAERQRLALKDKYFVDCLFPEEDNDYEGPPFYWVEAKSTTGESYASWTGSIYLHKQAVVTAHNEEYRTVQYTLEQYLRRYNYRERAIITKIDANGFVTELTTILAG